MKLLCILLLVPSIFALSSALKNVLSFGGNGMIGSAVLHRLIQTKMYQITMVSRGSWHYDSGIRIKPFVNAVVCDRNRVPKCDNCSINALSHCDDLMKVINETQKFDLVLDFSAYEPKWVHDAIDVLKTKEVGLYTYISSDAVYEVSIPKATKRLSREEDAVRPPDPKMREKLNKDDPYGHAKLAGEEALMDQTHFPWVAFRYADVIGPRDVTHRFAFYHTWLKFYDDIKVPFYLPKKLENVEESITYVEDAADMIVKTFELGPKVWNNAYNLATFPPLHSLESFVRKMADFMNVTLGETDPSDANELYMYPTVFAGGMDITKAKDMLGFQPTNFDEALRESIKWYDREFAFQYDYREGMIADLMARIVPRERRDVFYLAVDRELRKAGVENSNYKAKRKGDIEFLERYERPVAKVPNKDEL